MMPQPKVEFDDEREVVIINGIKFSYWFFEGFARFDIGSVVRIDERRSDGTLVLTRLLKEDEK